MLYEKYEQRMQRIFKLLKKIYQFRVLIISMVSVVLLFTTFFGVSKGRIYDVSIPSSFTYGQQTKIKTSAFFSSATYYYRLSGESDWKKEQPVRSGSYEVKITTNQLFGNKLEKIYAFEIKPKAIELKLKDTTVFYGSQPEVTAELVLGDYIDSVYFSYEDMSSAKTNLIVDEIVIKNSNHEVVTDSYLFTTNPKEVTFSQRPITVKPVDLIQTYDGTTLSSSEAELISGTLLENHRIEIVTLGTQLNVGSSENVIQEVRIFDGDLDVTQNYQVTKLKGHLEVTKRLITIETFGDVQTYDGTPLENLEYSIVEGSLVEDETLNLISKSSITNTGVVANQLAFEVLSKEGEGHDNYEISYQYGNLEVTPRLLLVQTYGAEKTYDGTSLKNEAFQLVSGSLLKTHQFTLESFTQIVDVGSIVNQMTLSIYEDEVEMTSNYHITYEEGLLEVKPASITIKTGDLSKVYDGQLLENPIYEVTSGKLIDTHVFDLVSNTRQTNVGIVDNVIELAVICMGISKTHNYEINYEYGLIEVLPKKIEIKTLNNETIYDGKPFISEAFELSDELVNGHITHVSSHTSMIDVGEKVNELEILIFDDAIDVTFNYDISYTFGTLKVNKRPITVSPAYSEKAYDGTPLTSNEIKLLDGELVLDHKVVITTNGLQTSVGTSTNEIITAFVYEGEKDVTSNYELSYVTEVLKVIERPITLKTSDATKIYDGTSLFSESFNITEGTLVLDHAIIVTSKTNIIESGSVYNDLTIVIMSGLEDVSANYHIKYDQGILVIEQRSITIKPIDQSKVYDGVYLTTNESEIMDNNLVDGHYLIIQTMGQQLDAGVSSNAIFAYDIYDPEGNLKTYNYKVTLLEGTLEVLQRTISIETSSSEKVYDDQLLISEAFTITEGSLVLGHQLLVSESTSILTVQTAVNLLNLIVYDGVKDQTDNYNIVYTYGLLEIKERPITIKPLDQSKIYDGESLTSNIVEDVNKDLIESHIITIETNGSLIDAGIIVNSITRIIIENDKGDVTNNYQISFEDGSLEILKRPITLRTFNDTKVYDGLPLFNESFEIIEGSYVDFQYGLVVNHTEITDLGVVKNNLEIQVVSDAFNYTHNYDIIYEEGLLEILKRPISVKPQDIVETYDGSAITTILSEVIEGSLVMDHHIIIETNGTQTNVGVSPNEITNILIYDNSREVTHNYQITLEIGYIEVLPRELTIETGSDTKVYDGKPLYNLLYFITEGSLVYGHQLILQNQTEVTDAIRVENVLRFDIYEGEVNQSNNYAIKYQYGVLEVTPRQIVILTSSKVKVYDGSPLSDEDYTFLSGELVESHEPILTSKTEIIDVMTVDNYLSFSVYEGSIDRSNNYEIEVLFGTLEITKRPITFLTESESSVYDGTYLINTNHSIVLGSLVDTHHSVARESTQIKDVGILLNEMIIEIYEDTNLKTFNYEVTVEFGMLEITSRPITVLTNTAEKVYDGLMLYDSGYSIISGSLVDKEMIEVIEYERITSVGSKANILEIIILENNRISDNYDVTYVYGTLEVIPRPISIKPEDKTKVYDGTPLTSNEAMVVGGSGLVLNHIILITTNGTQTDVGVSTNEITEVSIFLDSQEMTFNYEITTLEGILEVTHRLITIHTESDSKIYDALPMVNHQFQVLSGNLVLDHTFTLKMDTEITDVGEIQNVLFLGVVDHTNQEVSNNYSISYEYGILSVIPRQLWVTTGSGYKVYNGEPLEVKVYYLQEGELINNHYFNLKSYTSVTEAGVYDNALELDIFENDLLKTHNYEIIYTFGQLTIDRRTLLVETLSAEKIYDGTPLFKRSFNLVEGSLVGEDYLDIDEYPTIINVSLVINNLVLKVLNNGVDKTSNYDIQYQYGTLEVKKQALTIKTNDQMKVYDGFLLFDDTTTVISGTLIEGESITVLNRAELLYVNTIENTVEIDILRDSISVKDNYDISYLYGTLLITPRPITIQTSSDDKYYDGTPLFNESFSVVMNYLVNNDRIEVNTKSEITEIGVIDNVLGIHIYHGELIVSGNYDITYVYGQLTVLKRAITVKPKDESKPYDGTYLVSNQAEIVDGIESQSIVIHLVTDGSQLDIGYSDNHIIAITILLNGVDVTENFNVLLLKGALEVTPRILQLETINDSKYYDGTALINDGYVIIEGTLVSGDTLSSVSRSELVEIDVIDNIVSYVVLRDGLDISENYEIIYTYGLLEVLPITLTISTPDDKKEYDGTPLENPNYTLIGEPLDNHGLSVSVLGSITEVGKVFNDVYYTLLDKEGNDVLSYYTIIENIGTLEVFTTKVTLNLLSGTAIKLYDGQPLTKDSYEIIEGSLIHGHTLEMNIFGTITEPGVAPNDYMYTIYDANGVDVTETYYYVVSKEGKLTVIDGNDNGSNDISEGAITPEGSHESLFGGPLFRIYSEVTDSVYLRDKSYGDYNKSGFDSPAIYDSPFGVSPLQFSGLVMASTSEPYNITIEALQGGLSYYLPYYSLDGYHGNVNDVFVSHHYGLSYEVNYYPINDVDFVLSNLNQTVYNEIELAYRSHVYDTYLQVPQETKNGLLEIARDNGLNPNSQNIIHEVKNYIQNAAIYNLGYKPIPSNVDKALYFLTISREGICQQFALAGTMMYRSLGIPARYVTGYAVSAQENSWVEVGVDKAHAWVEIYIDGFGWVPVEVTAGGFGGSGGSGGSGTGEGSGTGTTPDGEGSQAGSGSDFGDSDYYNNDKPIIEIITANDSKPYDGTPLINHTHYVIGGLKPGHEVIVSVEGAITLVGETINALTYTVLDQLGNDVSSEYNIRTNPGTLVIVPNNDLPIIEIQPYDIKVAYSGLTVKPNKTQYYIYDNALPTGYTIEFEIVGEQKYIGKSDTYIDKGTLRIFDSNQMDVTNQFNVVTYSGSIEVIKSAITVVSSSTEKFYDGEPLTLNDYYISRGSTKGNDTIEVIIVGTITEVGEITNKVDKVTMLNEYLEDVTQNYQITIKEGTLIVMEDY